MKRADGKVVTEELPSFLDDAESDAARFADHVTEDEICDDEYREPDDIDSEADLEATDFDPARSRRVQRQPRTPGNGVAVLASLVGLASWIGAIGIGTTGEVPQISKFGVTPTTLFVLGAIAFATAIVRRGIADVQHHSGASNAEATEELGAHLAGLLQRQGNGDGALGDVEHVMLSLQRLEEKTNNLTKAIKMYGKPLMDIANHGTELAATVAQIKTSVESGNESARAAYSRFETALEKSSGGGATQDLLGRIEVSVQAVAQRLEDSEVRKSLMRIEDASDKTTERLQELSRGESVEAAAKNMQQALDATANRLQTSLDDMRDGHIGTLDNTVRDIRREVATIATAVSQIQASIKSGSPRAAASLSTTAPTSAAAPTAAGDSAPTAVAPGGNDQAAAGDGEHASGYQTGARRCTGKNVLGAIAKLKQMKS